MKKKLIWAICLLLLALWGGQLLGNMVTSLQSSSLAQYIKTTNMLLNSDIK